MISASHLSADKGFKMKYQHQAEQFCQLGGITNVCILALAVGQNELKNIGIFKITEGL